MSTYTTCPASSTTFPLPSTQSCTTSCRSSTGTRFDRLFAGVGGTSTARTHSEARPAPESIRGSTTMQGESTEAAGSGGACRWKLAGAETGCHRGLRAIRTFRCQSTGAGRMGRRTKMHVLENPEKLTPAGPSSEPQCVPATCVRTFRRIPRRIPAQTFDLLVLRVVVDSRDSQTDIHRFRFLLRKVRCWLLAAPRAARLR